MSGFPIRPDRSAFGPTPVNRYPVRDTTRELDGPTVGDLMMWQIAGSGLVVARAWALLSIDGAGAVTLAQSAEAWDPKALYVPTVTKNGAGDYKVAYAATYPDKDGVAQTLNLIGAQAIVQDTGTYIAFAKKYATNREIQVVVRAIAGWAAADPVSTEILVLGW